MLVLMFLRTRKRKSKIDFALLDKSNKMVSGVKLILTKQNPRRLNTARRLRIKTTTTTKQLQRRLYTPKNSSPPLLSYTVTQRRRTRDSHVEKKRGGDGSSPASSTGATHTTIYTMHTELRWGQSGRGSPRALPALLPAPGPLGRAATRQPRLALRPSLRPASCRPFLPSLRARALVLPPTRGSLALRRGCSPAPLPAGGSVALPGAGSVQFAGQGAAVEPPGKSPPGPVLRSQQSLRLPRRASSGPPAPPLLPLTSAPQLAFGSRLPLCSRPSSRSLSQEDEDDEDEELRVRPECL